MLLLNVNKKSLADAKQNIVMHGYCICASDEVENIYYAHIQIQWRGRIPFRSSFLQQQLLHQPVDLQTVQMNTVNGEIACGVKQL